MTIWSTGPSVSWWPWPKSLSAAQTVSACHCVVKVDSPPWPPPTKRSWIWTPDNTPRGRVHASTPRSRVIGSTLNPWTRKRGGLILSQKLRRLASTPSSLRHSWRTARQSAPGFAPKDQELASVFATEASIILSGAGLDVTEVQLATRLSEVLRTREIISQAQGVLMERDGLSADKAYTALRRFSVLNKQPLRERAKDVVISAQRFERLQADRSVENQNV
jgi:hypothetical protein